jgi:hypothetical protein
MWHFKRRNYTRVFWTYLELWLWQVFHVLWSPQWQLDDESTCQLKRDSI